MRFVLDVSHCFHQMDIIDMAFFIRLCQQPHLRKNFRMPITAIIALRPQAPDTVAIYKIVSDFPDERDHRGGIDLCFHRLAAQRVKRFVRFPLLFYVRHTQQRIDGHAEQSGKHREKLHIRVSRSLLPTADRLAGNADLRRQFLLRQIGFPSQRANVVPDCKFHHILLAVHCRPI